MKDLSLFNNKLTGKIPTELSNIVGLDNLQFDGHHSGKDELRAAFGKERISKMTFKYS